MSAPGHVLAFGSIRLYGFCVEYSDVCGVYCIVYIRKGAVYNSSLQLQLAQEPYIINTYPSSYAP